MSWQLAAAAASGLGGFFGQKSANKTNIKLAREQMAFQERMSNSAYQRAMADMRKAGLNPILAAKQPASSPGGQTARVESALGAGISNFNQTNSALAQRANLNANTNQTNAKTKLDNLKLESLENPDDSPTQRQAKLDIHTLGLPSWAINQVIGLSTEGKSEAEQSNFLKNAAIGLGVVLSPFLLGLLTKRLIPAAAGKTAAKNLTRGAASRITGTTARSHFPKFGYGHIPKKFKGEMSQAQMKTIAKWERQAKKWFVDKKGKLQLVTEL